MACVVAVGLAGAASAAGPSSTTTTTAAPAPAPETFIDPDTEAKAGDDVVSTIRWLSPNGSYELDLQNTSDFGYVDTFTWVPPVGLTVTAITSTKGGTCVIQSGDIDCSGKIAPPICTCRPGGSLIVDFTATGNQPIYVNGHILWFGLVGSQTLITSITPVPYHIPSFISPKNV